MPQDAIFLPVCVLVFWTLGVLSIVPVVRTRAARAGRVHVKDFRYGESPNVPGDVSLPNRAFMNLLELPVLFYVLCLALFATGRVDGTYLAMAWSFAALRSVHTLVHLTYNNVLHRLAVFALGMIVLAAMWARFAMSLL